jgi:two-component system response regulator AtoC
MIEKVLVADDEMLLRDYIAELLKRRGLEVILAANGQEAIELFSKTPVDLVITDLKMPYKDGIEVLKSIKNISPTTPVIIATAHASVETAVEAMQLGAYNFVIKPFAPETLELMLDRLEESIRTSTENQFHRSFLGEKELIAHSPSMQKMLKDLEKIAKSNASVFINGESGTGKEVISAAIHRASLRVNEPFIKVNCAAIPETLVESEFFGHERGAFTGALIKKTGRFELADRGTLMLDEVTEIPLGLQAKLLRVIQEKEFERVGGTRSIKVDVRMLATSNRHMTEAIDSGIFREDLYYRLNVIPLYIPPLRERPEDIIPLAEYFLCKFCLENHKPYKTLTESAKQKLLSYDWPGNVRELANTIERTVVLDFDSVLSGENFYLQRSSPQKTAGNLMTLHEMEKHHILERLETLEHNRTKAAESLGISVRTLRNKLHEYGLMEEGH